MFDEHKSKNKKTCSQFCFRVKNVLVRDHDYQKNKIATYQKSRDIMIFLDENM